MEGEHCGQDLEDVAVVAWQDEWVTVVSAYHKNELCVTINKAYQEETKPVFVCIAK
jgi:hypothetical protein